MLINILCKIALDFRLMPGRIYDQGQAELQALSAGIPHHWCDNNPIARYEGYYASVFYSHFAALGVDLRVEDATNQERSATWWGSRWSWCDLQARNRRTSRRRRRTAAGWAVGP